MPETRFSVSPWTGREGSTLLLSVCFFFAGFVCPFPCLSQLPVWPSTRRPWPPPCSLRNSGRVGAQGPGAGVRCGKGLQRRRSQSSGEFVRARHGFGRAQLVGWQASWGCGGRSPSPRWRLARYRHNDGVTTPPGWESQARHSPAQRKSLGRGLTSQGTDVP